MSLPICPMSHISPTRPKYASTAKSSTRIFYVLHFGVTKFEAYVKLIAAYIKIFRFENVKRTLNHKVQSNFKETHSLKVLDS